MKAITLHQPWATLVAIGAKQLETRSWITWHRGPLAIHAGKDPNHWPTYDVNGWGTEAAERCLEVLGQHGYRYPADLPYGAVIATVDLVDCIHSDGENEIEADDRLFGDVRRGRYLWVLFNVTPLPSPIPARGKQGLWDWPPSDSRLITAQKGA